MKILKTISILVGLVLMLLACDIAHASGWRYSKGYWWKNGYPYVRKKVYYSGCNRGYFWRYYRVHQASSNNYTRTAGGTEKWRSQLNDILADHMKRQNQIAASANEHNEYLETLDKVLGKIQPYGYAPALANPHRASLSTVKQSLQGGYQYNPYAQQGSTVYGYSEYAKAYRDMDLNLLMNQANNHTRNAQELSGKAEARFKGMVQDVLRGQERVAEIQARAQAAARVLGATAPQEQTESRRTWIKIEQNSKGELNVQKAQPGSSRIPEASGVSANQQALFRVLANRCVSCHGAENDAGDKVSRVGIDLTQYLAFDENEKRKVRDSILWKHPDPAKHMPRTPDGSRGEMLPFDEIVLFAQ